jgi:hypothetical protein
VGSSAGIRNKVSKYRLSKTQETAFRWTAYCAMWLPTLHGASRIQTVSPSNWATHNLSQKGLCKYGDNISLSFNDAQMSPGRFNNLHNHTRNVFRSHECEFGCLTDKNYNSAAQKKNLNLGRRRRVNDVEGTTLMNYGGGGGGVWLWPFMYHGKTLLL